MKKTPSQTPVSLKQLGRFLDEDRAVGRRGNDLVFPAERYTNQDAAIDMKMTGRCPFCRTRIDRHGDGGQCPGCGFWVDGALYGRASVPV